MNTLQDQWLHIASPEDLLNELNKDQSSVNAQRVKQWMERDKAQLQTMSKQLDAQIQETRHYIATIRETDKELDPKTRASEEMIEGHQYLHLDFYLRNVGLLAGMFVMGLLVYRG